MNNQNMNNQNYQSLKNKINVGNLFISAGIASASVISYQAYTNKSIIKEFFKNPSLIQEIASFSEYTSNELCKPLKKLLELNTDDTRNLRVLEIGAGRGHVTRHIIDTIIKYKKNGDKVTFDIIEYTKDFEEDLLKIANSFENNKFKINVYVMDYINFRLPNNEQFDIIISSLPEQTLQLDVFEEVLNKYQVQIKNHGVVSRIRYVIKLSWFKYVLNKKKAKNLLKNQFLQEEFNENTNITTQEQTIYRNIPPVTVFHNKITKNYI